jgi:hypothetical protein
MDPPSTPDPTEAAKARLAKWQFGLCAGCGSLILLTFVLLAWTVWHGDRSFTTDPARVEEHLQAIVPCQIPPGYRAFQGAYVPGRQRCAFLVPGGFRGERLDPRVALLVSAWTTPPGEDEPTARRGVVDFLVGLSGDRVGAEASADPAPVVSRRLRGREVSLERHTVRVGEEVFRLEVLSVPGGPGGGVHLGFLGREADFDEAAVEAFLASVE